LAQYFMLSFTYNMRGVEKNIRKRYFWKGLLQFSAEYLPKYNFNKKTWKNNDNSLFTPHLYLCLFSSHRG
jgi:hypothetical protein